MQPNATRHWEWVQSSSQFKAKQPKPWFVHHQRANWHMHNMRPWRSTAYNCSRILLWCQTHLAMSMRLESTRYYGSLLVVLSFRLCCGWLLVASNLIFNSCYAFLCCIGDMPSKQHMSRNCWGCCAVYCQLISTQQQTKNMSVMHTIVRVIE